VSERAIQAMIASNATKLKHVVLNEQGPLSKDIFLHLSRCKNLESLHIEKCGEFPVQLLINVLKTTKIKELIVPGTHNKIQQIKQINILSDVFDTNKKEHHNIYICMCVCVWCKFVVFDTILCALFRSERNGRCQWRSASLHATIPPLEYFIAFFGFIDNVATSNAESSHSSLFGRSEGFVNAICSRASFRIAILGMGARCLSLPPLILPLSIV
jgi:hypothetical protein